MDKKLDEAVVKAAQRLAELRPEKYRFEGDEGYEAFPRLKNKYITLLIPMQSIDYDYLNMILADEGMYFSIEPYYDYEKAETKELYWGCFINSLKVKQEWVKSISEIPALKQTMLKEIFVRFVELLEKK